MTNFVWRRARAVAKKEIYHILRDPFTLILALIMPLFMVVMYGLAIEFNVKNVGLSVNDMDHTQSSRRLLDAFASSHYFLVDQAISPREAMSDVTAERDRTALIIPPGFQNDLLAGKTGHVQLLIDGSDSSTVGPVLSYIGSIQAIASSRILEVDPPKPYELRSRFLFNPELNSRWFVIPGLTVVIMAMLSILLTAMTVAREWENGSMELLLSTPVKPLEIIVGKLAPYGALGIIAVTLVYLIARSAFGVPFVGSMTLFGFGCLIFLVTYLAQGLLISVVTRKQVVAMQLSMMSGLLPSTLLSGFIFPIESMPTFFRYFTMIFPARWFMRIARDTFLKGSDFVALSTSFFALSVLCALMIKMATSKFKRDLEP